MGNEPSTQKKGSVPVYNKLIDKNKLEVLLKKIFFTTQLQKDRKKGLVSQQEKELLNLIAQPRQQRNKDNEFAKASSIVSNQKSVKAQECVMRYCDILKDRAQVIQMSKGDPNKITDLLPFIESVVWGCNNLNLDCVKELEQFLHSCFGPEVYGHLSQGHYVLPELKECFNSILPTEREIKVYLMEFCKKNAIEIELMNEIGHNISEAAIADLPGYGGKGGNDNMGGYGGHGGYGGYGGTGGAGGATINNFDPSKNITININGTPNSNNIDTAQTLQENFANQHQNHHHHHQQQQQHQFQQNQQYHPQQQYNQPHDQQFQHQQQNPNLTFQYQQQQQQQQQNYNQYQPQFQQPGGQQPFQDNNYQPQFQQFNAEQKTQPSYQSPYDNINQFAVPSIHSNSSSQNSANTANNYQVPSNQHNHAPTMAPNGVSLEGESTAGFPMFKKMTFDQPPSNGVNPVNNNLDDFEARLKNIKDGL